MTEKEFDLVQLLEESSKQLEMDSFKAMGRRDGYEDVIKYIQQNNLKVVQVVEEETAPEEAVETK